VAAEAWAAAQVEWPGCSEVATASFRRTATAHRRTRRTTSAIRPRTFRTTGAASGN